MQDPELCRELLQRIHGKGTIYDIEMQVTDTKELPKRTRYYQSMLDLQMIDKG